MLHCAKFMHALKTEFAYVLNYDQCCHDITHWTFFNTELFIQVHNDIGLWQWFYNHVRHEPWFLRWLPSVISSVHLKHTWSCPLCFFSNPYIPRLNFFVSVLFCMLCSACILFQPVYDYYSNCNGGDLPLLKKWLYSHVGYRMSTHRCMLHADMEGMAIWHAMKMATVQWIAKISLPIVLVPSMLPDVL